MVIWKKCGAFSCCGARMSLLPHWEEGIWWCLGPFFCVQEIELSLALRKHWLLNVDLKCVSSLLPCSKTDPKALVRHVLGTSSVVTTTRSWALFMRPTATAGRWMQNSGEHHEP